MKKSGVLLTSLILGLVLCQIGCAKKIYKVEDIYNQPVLDGNEVKDKVTVAQDINDLLAHLGYPFDQVLIDEYHCIFWIDEAKHKITPYEHYHWFVGYKNNLPVVVKYNDVTKIDTNRSRRIATPSLIMANYLEPNTTLTVEGPASNTEVLFKFMGENFVGDSKNSEVSNYMKDGKVMRAICIDATKIYQEEDKK